MPARIRFSFFCLAAFALAGAAPAAGQSIAVVVNGQPILTSEVKSRAALLTLSGGKGGAAAARQELIDEKLKVTEAKRYGIAAPDSQVEAAFASIAQRTKLTPAQFTQAIGQRGVSAQTLKDRIRAEIGWAQLVRRKFAATIAAREKDVVASIAAKSGPQTDNRAVQYVLRQIVFVLPKGATDAQVAQRRAEANSARGRFPGCEQAVQFAASLRDVAVKEPVTRSSAQMGKELNDSLSKLKNGGVTSPERGEQGIEMVAVCDRKDIADDSMLRRQAQEELGSRQAEEQAKKYLDQIRSRAIVQVIGEG